MKRARLQALVGLVAVFAVAVVALLSARATAPKPADAPMSEFAAARAMRHVEELASRAHPLGSPAHQRARAYVLGELSRLGWEAQVQDTWTRKRRGSLLRYARLRNVIARQPGATETPVVLLASHYDSVPSGPGAGDASAPVASILEALRALEHDPPARNLRVLITDGEEAGLLGAQAFAENHPWMGDVGLVLNFEARGNAGVPWMFETGSGATRLVKLFGASVPRPFANSLSAAIYRRMPNDTDYTVFRAHGVQGLNMAMIGFHPAYHSQLDTAANLDRRSLQAMGDSVVGLARGIPGNNWNRNSLRTTYFNPLGSWFVIYPVQIDQGVLVVGIFLAGIWLWGRIDGLLKGIVFAVGAWGALVVAVGVSWWLLVRLNPAVIETPNRVPYSQWLLIAGWLLLGLAVVTQFSGWMTRDTQSVATGLVLLAGLGVLTVTTMPEATYMIAWLLLTMSGAAWLTIFDPPRRWLWLTLGALPVPMLYAPLAREALLALTPHRAWLVAALVGVGMLALLPHLAQLGSADRSTRIVMAAGGVALILVTGVMAEPGARTPRPVRLAYAVTPQGEPLWVSRADELDPWLSEQVGSEWLPSDWSQRELDDVGDLGLQHSPAGPRRSWVADAPDLELPGPQIVHLRTGSDSDGRWLDVQVTLPREGEQLWLALSGAVVDKVQWLGVEAQPESDGEVRQLVMLAPRSTETLRLWARGSTPVWITAYELSYGLPDLVSLPDHLIRSNSWTDFSVRVGTRVAVDDFPLVERPNRG